MPARLIHGTVLVLFFLSICPAQAPGLDVGTVRLAAGDYPPFYIQTDGEILGIGAEIGRELFSRLHIPAEISMYPLKRMLTYMQDGDVDGTMILVKSPKREKYLLFIEPVVPGRGYIWSAADRKDGPIDVQRLEDLRSYKAGITIGYSYGKAFDALLKSMDTDMAPKEYFSFKKLMAHRVDFIPATEIVVKSLIKNHPEFRGKFVHPPKAFHQDNYYMVISRKSPLIQIIPRIKSTLKEMKADGFIDAVIKKYTEYSDE